MCFSFFSFTPSLTSFTYIITRRCYAYYPVYVMNDLVMLSTHFILAPLLFRLSRLGVNGLLGIHSSMCTLYGLAHPINPCLCCLINLLINSFPQDGDLISETMTRFFLPASFPYPVILVTLLSLPTLHSL